MTDAFERLLDYWQRGGVLMGPLALAGVVLWFAMGVRMLTLRDGRRNGAELVDRALAGRLLTPHGPLGAAALLGVRELVPAAAGVRSRVEAAFAPVRAELRRGAALVGAMVALAPLLGLLGTVLGMIETFESLADRAMFAQSGGIAGGIAEAMLTTQTGLTIAVPGLVLGRLLDRRAASIERELDRMEDILTAEAYRRGIV